MSITWLQTPVVSEVVVNGTTYYLKDAEARSIIETLSGNGLVTTVSTDAASTPYGVTWTSGGTTITGTWVASDTSMPYLVLVPQDGSTGTYVEYVTARTGAAAPYTYTWERIGTTETDLSDYAKTADLGDLAFKDTASGSVTTSTINLTNGTTTAAGSITVTLKDSSSTTTVSSTGTANAQTFTGQKYKVTVTPTTSAFATSGVTASVSGEVLTLGTAGTSNAMTGATAALAKDATNGVQIEGTNASSSVSVSGTYYKQVVDTASFSGSASTVTGTVTAAGAQTVTVS